MTLPDTQREGFRMFPVRLEEHLTFWITRLKIAGFPAFS